MPVLRTTLFAAMSLMLVSGAEAGFCVVDYETFEVRSELLPTDHDTFVAEQTGQSQPWYLDGAELNVRGTPYTKFGLPRTVTAADLVFHAFEGSVPILKVPGDGETPEVLYVMADPASCTVQPYMLAAALAPPAPSGGSGNSQFGTPLEKPTQFH